MTWGALAEVIAAIHQQDVKIEKTNEKLVKVIFKEQSASKSTRNHNY